ncbi:uncharacterized protein EDB91DRAFT_1130575 [Suillus paluster]|uniref:uncharacterized protein n=1 Tax=Suillus paluster TaxID=48578 RepID=UPI001B872628|nr:uncharacterized protein EDB91DRAFT_1130575 [Suillus paluster]KAG1741461.1 hypothetical protein EDB91DRAFT_1130575 [Suillus paluster]
MPGPRGGKAKAKKPKPVVHSVARVTSDLEEFSGLVDDIEGAEGWNTRVKVLCEFLQLPDLSRRSGLKKVHANFNEVYHSLDDVYVANIRNEKITGAIIGIYTKMCADAILRDKLFQKGLVSKITPLIKIPSTRYLALRALTTVTHHGGVDVRKEISLESPSLLKTMQENPDDLRAAEMAISTMAHAIGAAINQEDPPAPRYLKAANVNTLIPIVIDFMRKPGASIQLLYHGLELLTHPVIHCWSECKAHAPLQNLLVACLRSADLTVRVSALGGLLRLEALSSEEDQRQFDPHKLMAAIERRFPDHLTDILMDYGAMRCDTFLTMASTADNQKAMMQCAQDKDLYSLGLKLAELITRNEFSIAEGGFQMQDPRTGQIEINRDIGLPFIMWSDALPHCARAIRAKGRAGEEDLADMITCKRGIQRNPKFAYFYYVITLGKDHCEGLRSAKKGLKCPKMTPFVRFGLLHRAVELAGNLGVCRIQESSPGDRKYDEGVAFLMSAMEDAKVYTMEAPPDARHMKNVIYWYICLTLAIKGPETPADLQELQVALKKLGHAEEFSILLGTIPPKTQLRLTQQNIVKRYPTAVREWKDLVARFDEETKDEHTISLEKAEDDLAAWLDDLHLEQGETDETRPQRCSHPRVSPNTVALYRCSWCGNPSAALRKCSGCEKARYCDGGCQKSHWSEHKVTCRA